MAYEFRFQDPGEGIHEAEIVEIIASEGEHVEEGDNILIAETDKAAVEIPAPVSGELTEFKVAEGDIVKVGDVLAVFDEDGSSEPGDAEDLEETSSRTGKSRKETDSWEAAREEEDSDDSSNRDDEDQAEASRAGAEEDTSPPDPAAKAERIAASGSGQQQADEKTGNENEKKGGEDDVLATPAVRGLAREHKIDLAGLEGSGKDGRILEKDVRKAAGSRAAKDEEDEAETTDEADDTTVERVKLRSIRRSTAKQMSRAWAEIPHVTHQDEIDITDIEILRRDHAAKADEEGAKLTLTPFIVKALAGALGEHPRFNARFDADNEEIELVRAVNVGVAIDTERGLLVPVVRDAQSKTVLGLAKELAHISDKLKEQRADKEMLRGGTITLTNVGSIGGTGFMPIINPPQVAIFGAARAGLKSVFTGDLDNARASIRLVLPVCLTFDHRVNDGADAARFMNSIKRLLSDPEELALRS